MKGMKRRIAERARRMHNRRVALRQIQFDIQQESKQFLEHQLQRLAIVQERKRRRGSCTHELRNRKDWQVYDQQDDEEIVAIGKETEEFERAQKRKLDNLIEEEAKFKQQHELEHQSDLRFYAKQVMEEYEDWLEEYESNEYDTDSFPRDDYNSETSDEDYFEESFEDDEDEDDEEEKEESESEDDELRVVHTNGKTVIVPKVLRRQYTQN